MQMNRSPGEYEVFVFAAMFLDFAADTGGLGVDGEFFPFRGRCRNAVCAGECWDEKMFVAFPNGRVGSFFTIVYFIFDILCLDVVERDAVGGVIFQDGVPCQH